MWVCVCVCVGGFVCGFVRVSVGLCVCQWVCVCVCVSVGLCVCVGGFVCVYLCAHVSIYGILCVVSGTAPVKSSRTGRGKLK